MHHSLEQALIRAVTESVCDRVVQLPVFTHYLYIIFQNITVVHLRQSYSCPHDIGASHITEEPTPHRRGLHCLLPREAACEDWLTVGQFDARFNLINRKDSSITVQTFASARDAVDSGKRTVSIRPSLVGGTILKSRDRVCPR